MVREIFRDLNLSEEEYKVAEEKFRRLIVKKGDFLLNEGQCAHYQYYVYSGCLRSYFLHESGKEHTIQFAMNDWWISDYTAFFTGGHSMLYIECLQDAEIYKISKESLKQLHSEVPLTECYFRLMMEKSFVSFQNRIISDLSLSAKDTKTTSLYICHSNSCLQHCI